MDRLEQEQQRVVSALKVSEEERSAAEDARDQYHKLYLEMLERCRKLERGLLGQKAERLPDNEQQLTLSILQMALGHGAVEELEEDTEVEAHRRRNAHGRKPIPEHLPRVEIEVVDKRETKKTDRGIVTYHHRVLNQRDEAVLEARIQRMIRRAGPR